MNRCHKKGPSKINDDCTWLQLIKSSIHRYGVIALERIPANTHVIEYTGVLYNRAQAKKLKDHTYVWTVGWNNKPWYWIIDGRTNGSGAEYVNHSCDPNLAVWFDGRRIFYYSLRAIKKGEELTIDYNFDWDDDPKARTICKCGAKKCRGTINVKDKN